MHFLLISASCLSTASLASGILGALIIIVIITSRYLHINPDNVATPIAASLGDLITLLFLSKISQFLYALRNDHSRYMGTLIFLLIYVHMKIHDPCNHVGESGTVVVSLIVVVIFLALIPFWIWLAYRNKYTQKVLYEGWTPVVSAMLISR